ncbi:hypothetical protein PIB30_076991 [Stylosanthes scabra]|uniref:Uncharacterized protein n=1 Tax=Stylosanthes scabra TaxID=79078 RepID=A0ABU6SSB3_9FABA|nr:hypothetical protein [Stylosanthes scabra]
MLNPNFHNGNANISAAGTVPMNINFVSSSLGMDSPLLQITTNFSNISSPEEERILKEGLTRYAGQNFAWKCILIASMLIEKTARDVAFKLTQKNTFLFRVMPEYLASITSGYSVAIYTVGTFNNHHIGMVRIPVSNILSNIELAMKPCFNAVQVRRRQSRRFQEVLNVGARVVDKSYFPAWYKMLAIGIHDLKLKVKKHRRIKGLSSDESSFSRMVVVVKLRMIIFFNFR